jgi:type IV pilus assembly protein PilW
VSMNSVKFRCRQLGLSLIELMIALAIGVFLLLGLVEIFSATRAAYSTAEGLSRVQENGRFAVDFLRRDLRMVGHAGCQNERVYLNADALYNHTVSPATAHDAAAFAVRIDFPLVAFEYRGTAPGQVFDMTAGPVTGVGPGSFTPPLDASLGDLATDAIRGSDVLVVRYFSGESVPVRVNAATNVLQVADLADAAFFQARQMYGVSNCGYASLFQTLGAGASINVGPGGLNAVGFVAGGENGYAPPGSTAHRYEYWVYYVGLDGASGLPSLRARGFDAGRAGFLSAPQTLVEGVESLQLVFGADAGPTRDEILDVYLTAADVAGLDVTPRAAWSRVLNARVGLLMSSPAVAASVRDAASPPHRVADTVFNAALDGRVRQTYETVITVRNRVRN